MARAKKVRNTGGSASAGSWIAHEGTGFWPLLTVMAGLFIAVWAVFFPALDHDFVSWDDPTYVLENPMVLHPGDARSGDVWTTPVSLNYHPLTMKTLQWNSRSAERPRPSDPPNARPFIRLNIWLHALNTLLVLLFVRNLARSSLPMAAFCAVIFALHPMHVESVVWVSERKDVLYVFFFLAGLLAWQQWQQQAKALWYAVAVLLFIASCLSKAMAVVFPVVLLLVDIHERRSLKAWRPWLEKIPFFAISLLFGLIALNVQSGGDFHGLLHVERALGTTVAVAEKLPYTALDQVRYGAYGFTMYLIKFIAPFGLGTFHPYPEGADKGLLFQVAPLIMALVLVVAVWSLKRGRTVLFGVGFFTVSVALVLQFLPVGRAVMAERYTYLAYIGLAFTVAVGIDRLIRARPNGERIWWIIVALTGLVCVPFTRTQVAVWQNTRTLFRQVIAHYPHDADAYAILGSWYGKRSGAEAAPTLLDSAGAVLIEGVRAGAASGPLFEAVATCHGSQGRTDSALVWFDRAVSLGPITGQLMHNRAMARYAGDPEGCAEDLEQAIRIGHSRVGESYVLRARAHLRGARYTEGIADINTAMDRFGYRRADGYLVRGICHYNLGQKELALADAQKALKLDPASAQARELLEAAVR